MSKKNQPGVEFEKSLGNVFADLGLDYPDELFFQSRLGFHIHVILADKHLTRREVATLLGIKQPDVSHLMNGHFSRFTTDKLLDFLKRLEQKVTIRISPREPGEPYQEITTMRPAFPSRS